VNPYEETRLRTHRDDLARETRQLQLSGDSGAQPESDAEVFALAQVRRVHGRLEGWLLAIARWRPPRWSLKRSPSLPRGRVLPTAPTPRPTSEPSRGPAE
jgi:hypothetical protein